MYHSANLHVNSKPAASLNRDCKTFSVNSAKLTDQFTYWSNVRKTDLKFVTLINAWAFSLSFVIRLPVVQIIASTR